MRAKTPIDSNKRFVSNKSWEKTFYSLKYLELLGYDKNLPRLLGHKNQPKNNSLPILHSGERSASDVQVTL